MPYNETVYLAAWVMRAEAHLTQRRLADVYFALLRAWRLALQHGNFVPERAGSLEILGSGSSGHLAGQRRDLLFDSAQ